LLQFFVLSGLVGEFYGINFVRVMKCPRANYGQNVPQADRFGLVINPVPYSSRVAVITHFQTDSDQFFFCSAFFTKTIVGLAIGYPFDAVVITITCFTMQLVFSHGNISFLVCGSVIQF
jgi:hypothetical protein